MTRIKVNPDCLDQLMGALNSAMATLDGAVGSFSSLTNVPLIDVGATKIQNNVNAMSQRANSSSSLISTNKDSFMTAEVAIANMFDSIEVPINLENVDSSMFVETDGITVTKDDGTSVNNGGKIAEQNIDFRDEVNKDNLVNITKGPLNTQKMEDRYNQKKVALSDITTGPISTQNYEDRYSQETVNLSNITKDQLNNQIFDDRYTQEKVVLGNVSSGEQLNKQELRDSYDNTSFVSLNSVNSNPISNFQEYDQNPFVNTEYIDLYNMNHSNNANTKTEIDFLE